MGIGGAIAVSAATVAAASITAGVTASEGEKNRQASANAMAMEQNNAYINQLYGNLTTAMNDVDATAMDAMGGGQGGEGMDPFGMGGGGGGGDPFGDDGIPI